MAVSHFCEQDPSGFGVELVRTEPSELTNGFAHADTRIVLGYGSYGTESSDERRAEQIAEAVSDSEAERIHVLALGVERAKTLIRDARFRAEGEHLADALLARNELSVLDAL